MESCERQSGSDFSVELPPRSSFASILDRSLPQIEQERLISMRYLFYAMVVGLFEKGPISGSTRRKLMRHARSLGIEAFDAMLLIAGAEHRCGYGRTDLRAPELALLPDSPRGRFDPATGRLSMAADSMTSHKPVSPLASTNGGATRSDDLSLWLAMALCGVAFVALIL